MPPFLDSLPPTLGSSQLQGIATLFLSYFGLLWLSTLLWAARDAFSRSSNLLFHTFAIFLNLIPPPLGVLLYLIIRPSKTNAERYYENMEHQILAESAEDEILHCPACQTQAGKEHLFCHNCGKKLKTPCVKCKTPFLIDWPHCPQCGKKRLVKKEEKKEDDEGLSPEDLNE